MAIYQECNNSAEGNPNTGAKEQCLEGIMVLPVLTEMDFKFDSLADAKDLTKWEEAIAAKKMWPLYTPEEITTANTEPTYFEGKNEQYLTAEGKKITTYTSMLGLCSHAALAKFRGKKMCQLEFTEDGKVKGLMNDDGEVYGQAVKLNVAMRLDPTADRPASTLVTTNYLDFKELETNGAIFVPNFRNTDVYGIFDVHIQIVSATATNIKVKVMDGCAGGGGPVTDLVSGDLILRDATGALVTTTFTAADSTGTYTLTGTGFATGYTVDLAEVVTTAAGLSYEAVEPEPITVTP